VHNPVDSAFASPRLRLSILDRLESEKNMLKKTLMAAAAFSLAVSPAIAQSQAAPVQPADESVEGSELRGRGVLLPGLAVVAIILAILALTNTWPFDEDPQSP